MKMVVYKICIAILFTMVLVSSAPSLNKSPKLSSDLVIAVNNDILSEEISRITNHSLNSTQLDFKTISGKAESNASLTRKQSATKSKTLNLANTNTSTISNFTVNGSESTGNLMNLLMVFFSEIFNVPFEKSTSPTATTSSVRQSHVSHKHNRHSSSFPSFYHFSSPSLRMFLPFGRFFKNMQENGTI